MEDNNDMSDSEVDKIKLGSEDKKSPEKHLQSRSPAHSKWVKFPKDLYPETQLGISEGKIGRGKI